MALCSEMIDFIGLDVIDKIRELPGIREIAIMEEELVALCMGVRIDMVDTAGIEGAGTADKAVDFITLREKEFGKVGTVLAGDAGD